MPLFGAVHLAWIAGIVVVAIGLSWLCARDERAARNIRLTIGYGLALNELIWWAFRYSHEGFRFPRNMPLQLCDLTVWLTVAACITLSPRVVEFAYFAGLAGAGIAIITPDLWSKWPSYPAVYFFLAHGGIVIGVAVLVYGRIVRLQHGAVWRAFGMLLGYAAFVGVFNAVFHTNYMYLCTKPGSASLLDALGPWPAYLVAGAAVGLALFWLLWLPVRRLASAPVARKATA